MKRHERFERDALVVVHSVSTLRIDTLISCHPVSLLVLLVPRIFFFRFRARISVAFHPNFTETVSTSFHRAAPLRTIVSLSLSLSSPLLRFPSLVACSFPVVWRGPRNLILPDLFECQGDFVLSISTDIWFGNVMLVRMLLPRLQKY